MLRLDPVDVHYPARLDDALVLLSRHGDKAKVIAGGTDVVPNMKHGLHEPEVLVHLGRVAGLTGVQANDTHIEIGALTTVHDVAEHSVIAASLPSLADACGHIAGPQLRRMGTLGGNLCLDTRCLYYNQTHFWRESLGFCLKKDGTECHVVQGGQKCVAAASNDGATALLTFDTEVTLHSSRGERTLALDDFYSADGITNTVREADEVLTRVRVARTPPGVTRRCGFAKLRHRESIDYPLLSVAVRLDTDADERVVDAKVIVNALAARPKSVRLKNVVGEILDDALCAHIAKLAHKQCHPMTNISDDPSWRKDMVPVYVARALRNARTGKPAT